MPLISKTKFIEGLKCPKLLWYRYNRKAAIPPPSREALEILEQGRIVGELARKLFPGGQVIERDPNPHTTSARSLLAIKSRQPLFEAGIVHKNAYALPDILLPVEEDAWDLIEVKSSTRVKDDHVYDLAFQKYVYDGEGLKIRRTFILHLNNEYVKKGALEIERLFTKTDMTEEVAGIVPRVEGKTEELLKLIAGSEPEVWLNSKCKDCSLVDFCKSSLPQDHVVILYRGGKAAFDLMEQGVFRLKDIPPDFELSDKQAIQVSCHHKDEAHIDKVGIKNFVDQLEYPLFFLDFETIALAVPYYDQTRPYEDLFFQFSLHVVEKRGDQPVHYSYLAPGEIDPRPEVLARLQKLLGSKGSIVAFNATFEKMCLKYGARACPQYQEWFEEIEKRFVDLFDPFKNFLYYHPAQKGSTSIKKVLPALTGITYNDMEIGDGAAARFEYMRVVFGKGVDPSDRQRVFEALSKYCELDTLGMVEILNVLQEE